MRSSCPLWFVALLALAFVVSSPTFARPGFGAQSQPPPSGAAPGQAVPPGEGAKLEPAQLNDLLHKVYLAAFRFGDLLSVVQTDKWKMDDAARQSFNQTLETTRGELKALDESRQQFQEKPENSEAADKVDASLTTLLPSIEVVAAAVTQYDSPAQGAQYRQPGDQLRELQKLLRPYVLYLHAKAEGVLAPIPGVQTEVIQSSSAPKVGQPPPSAPPTPQGLPSAQPAPPPQNQPSSAQPTPPSGAAPGQAVPPGEGAKLEPAQLNDLLHKVYLAAFRFGDLLSVVQTDKWKMDDAARQSFNQTLEATRGELKVLDESRQQFQEKPENSEAADKVDASLTTLLPSIEVVAAAVTQYDSPAQGAQYRQPGDQLRELQKSLRTYVLYLHAKAEGVLAPIPGVQTEVIQPSSTPRVSQPADTSSPPPPLQPEQLKQILYKMYVPAFRVQDLLGQMQPEKWNASEVERSSFSQARAGLQAKLIEFERVRNQFAASPATADLAFQTYLSALNVQEPLEQVSRSLSAYGETKLADEFRQRGRELITAQQELVPYISYFLGRWDRAVQMFQSNLAACQNQLGYAMHLRTQVATPLPNVNPEFQGRGRKTGSSKETATKATATKPAKKTPPKKTSKKSSKPSPTRPDAPKT